MTDKIYDMFMVIPCSIKLKVSVCRDACISEAPYLSSFLLLRTLKLVVGLGEYMTQAGGMENSSNACRQWDSNGRAFRRLGFEIWL